MWQNTSVLVAGKKKKEGEDGESHMILLVFPPEVSSVEIFPHGNLTLVCLYLNFPSFISCARIIFFAFHSPSSAVGAWNPPCFLSISSQSFCLRQQGTELHIERQQENSVTRKKTTCGLFQIEKLALQKDDKTNCFSSKNKVSLTFGKSSESRVLAKLKDQNHQQKAFPKEFL